MSNDDSESVTVRDGDGRYLITVGDTDAGFVDYLDEGAHRVFLHTEVSPDFGGRGLAARLVRAALDDVRAQGRRAVNFCPYITTFVEKNHDWDDLLDGPTPEILAVLRARSSDR
jgi:uncharacterized protein